MHWSPLLQQCLDVLHAAQDTPRDQLLIAQVQMQRLLDDIAQTPWRSSETSHDMNIEISPAFYIKIFLNRLQDIMLGVSDPEIAQSRKLLHLLFFFSSPQLILFCPLSLPLMERCPKKRIVLSVDA